MLTIGRLSVTKVKNGFNRSSLSVKDLNMEKSSLSQEALKRMIRTSLFPKRLCCVAVCQGRQLLSRVASSERFFSLSFIFEMRSPLVSLCRQRIEAHDEEKHV